MKTLLSLAEINTVPCMSTNAVIAGMERFAFKGVASNLVTYLTDVVNMSNSAAAKTVNSWCGLTSIMPLLVAPLADSLWDHYSTILASSLFYVLVSFSLSFLFIFFIFLCAYLRHYCHLASYGSFRFWKLSFHTD